MRVAMAMAMDTNRLIGNAGGLPWSIPADLKHFKRVTMGKPIIMGRVTWESIGRPLPGRTNIVVTRAPDRCAQGAIVANDISTALALARQRLGAADECCVIGGAQLCAQVMPQTERLYLTLVHHEFSGDTWFDSYRSAEWNELAKKTLSAGEGSEYRLTFSTLERV